MKHPCRQGERGPSATGRRRGAAPLGTFGARALAAALLAAALVVPAAAAALDEQELEARRQRIEQLSPEQREELRRRMERFEHLPAEEQQRLRSLCRQVESDAEAQALREVLERYHEWLARLDPVRRAELLRMPPEKRLTEIVALRREEAERESRRLPTEDVEAVARWLERLALERFPLMRDLPEGGPGRERRRTLLGAIARGGPAAEPGGMIRLDEQEIEALAKGVSPEARRVLDGQPTPEARRALVGSWVRQTLGHYLYARDHRYYGSGPYVSSEVLRRFFDTQLSDQERRELLNLSGEDEMQQRLRRMYFERMRPPLGEIGPPQRPPRARPEGGPGDRPKPPPPPPQQPGLRNGESPPERPPA